ncbi:transcriptional regulator [Phyllobacterium phragmitis]|uniref:Transcriptional regulator n=1 Tax=Phyllobacterium phragmitis TaxID=2670329 RepID=A0A2S9INI6_9HYPH|nr:S24 family peptidase [Phyllobacterium phragmitis]PRD42090.1 transcriptional regulator [Phyllobacterium phragmitis]
MIYVDHSANVAGMESMGDRLRAARIAAKYSSATKAAESLGVSVSTYRAHENGQNEFGPEEADRYARKFGTTAAHLLTGQPSPNRPSLVKSFDPDTNDGERHDTNGAKNGSARGGERTGGADIPEIDVRAGMGAGGLVVEHSSDNPDIRFAPEVIRDYWRLPSSTVSQLNVAAGNIVALPSFGDSMEPTIKDGDAVFVDISHRLPSPPGIFALADEFGGVVIKRLEVVSRPNAEHVEVSVSSDNPRHTTRTLLLEEIHIIGRYIGRFTR